MVVSFLCKSGKDFVNNTDLLVLHNLVVKPHRWFSFICILRLCDLPINENITHTTHAPNG